MKEPAHTLMLNEGQVGQLANACAAYRSYALMYLEPAEERNRIIKIAQAVQGRLLDMQSRRVRWLVVTEDERQALQVMLDVLMKIASGEPPSEQRNRRYAETAALRVMLGHLFWHTQEVSKK